MSDTPRSRRDVLRWIGAGSALGVAGVGTAGASGPGGRQGASGEDTIVDTAVGSDEFDVLVAAVQEAGLVSALSGRRQLTVFAPTDAAFNELGITADTVGEIDDGFLTNVLLYHLTPGRRYASSVVEASSLDMLNGGTVTVDGTLLNDDQATIVGTNVEASNGVVHVIDGVLLP